MKQDVLHSRDPSRTWPPPWTTAPLKPHVSTGTEVSPIMGVGRPAAFQKKSPVTIRGASKRKTALIATDGRGYILVDDQLRTNISGIWAMGDCNGRGAFTHTSWNDFEIVAANLKSARRASLR